jgi:alcohol dehydrogenase (cytochrome c)
MKTLFLALFSAGLFGQAYLDPARLLQPPTDAWPTYNGDYSGRRYSTLTRINASNISSLSLAWVYRPNPGGGPAGGGGSQNVVIKGTPLQVNGVLYVTAPDHVWAVDARTGREIWHYVWKTKGGWRTGNRGAGILGNYLFFETPDCNLVSLNLKDGKERWHTEICDLDQFYYASVAPVIVKNHVITGVSGDDLDIPGYLESHDPETGALQWRWYARPEPGTPEAKTWPSLDAMLHGGGMTWVPSTYDPELNLLYLGTGNPQPVIAGRGRTGDNLYTECIVALNPDTGKLVWYFQPSPHDTHDWDAVQTPVLFDGEIDGQPRKLLAQASRNGWFFVLDRTNGKNLVASEYVKTNWTLGLDAKGQPIPNPAKEPKFDGTLVSPNQAGGVNWPPPSFSPQTGLFYVNAARAFSVYYLWDDDDKPEGWAGNDRGGWSEAMLQAIDYQTGKIRWSHKWPGPGGGARSGLLSTAGELLFAGDTNNNLVALDAASGEPLWHAGLHTAMTNGPITYELDGVQYLLVGAGDSLYAFAMLAQAAPAASETGFAPLFNGRDLAGWRVNENPEAFSVRDGAIVAQGPRSHLFYTGDVAGHNFTDFELKIDVMTEPRSNGGVYFQTEFQDRGWPAKGFEVQVNNTYPGDPRLTGSLYGVADNSSPAARDGEWFTQHIVVRGDSITVRVNDRVVAQWTQPPGWAGTRDFPDRRIRAGTIAVQSHDPASTVYYRNIRIKALK